MSKFLAATGAAIAAFTVTAVAFAGETVRSPNGEHLTIDVDVFPPKASGRTPTSVALGFHYFYGRSDGQRPRAQDTSTVRFQRGFRFNGALFPKCRLGDFRADPPRCPANTRIGSGTAEADARPAGPQDIQADVTLFNGEPQNGAPTTYFVARPRNTTIVSRLIGVTRNQPTGPYGSALELRQEPPPPVGQQPLFTPTRFDVRTLNRTVPTRVTRRIRGRNVIVTVRRGLIEAPPFCTGLWLFAQDLTYSTPTNERLRATDEAGCTR